MTDAPPSAAAADAAAEPIDTALVRRLADILSDTGLTEIEVERGDLRVRVARKAAAVAAPALYAAPPVAAPPPPGAGAPSLGDAALAAAEGAPLRESVAIARGETVAVAESSAGGLVAAALLAVPGASRYFLGGAVVYTAQAREALLRITPDQMTGLRSSSEPYAALLAVTVRESVGSTWGLAETGAARPTGNRYGDAAGHSCLAVDGPATRVKTVETGSADRAANMTIFAIAALTELEAAFA